MTSLNLANLPDAGQPIAGDKILTARDGTYVSLDGGAIVGSAAFAGFSDGVVNCLRELNTAVTGLRDTARGAISNVVVLQGQIHGLDIATKLAVSRSAAAVDQATAATLAVADARTAADAAREKADSALAHANGAFGHARSAYALAQNAIDRIGARSHVASDGPPRGAPIATVRMNTKDPGIANGISLQVPPNWNLFPPGTGFPTKTAVGREGIQGVVVPFYCDSPITVSGLSFIQSIRTGAAGTARQSIFTWNSATSSIGSAVVMGQPVQYAAKTADIYTVPSNVMLGVGWYAYVFAATSKIDLSAHPMGTARFRDIAIYGAGSNATAAYLTTSYTFPTSKQAIREGFLIDATTVLSPSERAGMSSPLIAWSYPDS
jgi:hypothetical protein